MPFHALHITLSGQNLIDEHFKQLSERVAFLSTSCDAVLLDPFLFAQLCRFVRAMADLGGASNARLVETLLKPRILPQVGKVKTRRKKDRSMIDVF